MCVEILYDHVAISFGDRPGQSLQRPSGDRTETAQSSCSHHLTQKTHDARALSLRASTITLNFWAPNDYLKSYVGLTISVR